MAWNDKVKQLLDSKNWDQKKLSEKSGITESSVSRYLRGDRQPRMDIIVNFAKALDVTTEFLLEDDEECNLNPYAEIATAIARNGSELSPTDKNKLIALLLSSGNE